VTFSWKRVLTGTLIGFFAIAALYGGYVSFELDQQNTSLEKTILELHKTVSNLETLQSANNDNIGSLTHSLQAAQNQNDGFASEIGQLSNTVGALQKLSQTDPQLLEKYSRVFFLSENYAPAQLSPVDTSVLYNKSQPQLILSGVLPFLEAMIAAASRDGVTLQVVSAYRSFYEQSFLKAEYKVTYGSGANQFSADQGYSEHQLGTAVDFGTPNVKNLFIDFASSTASQWLTDNAYKFGFIISYPKENTYYEYEPWHWRFVGIALAAKIHDDHEYFYNLAQRDIDAYLGNFFDQ